MDETVKVISLLLILGLLLVKGFDPCTTNAVLANQERRCPSTQMLTQFGLCDKFITEGWYRVNDASDIPTACPHPFQCDTQYPVWMPGSVPSVSDGEVDRTACVSNSVSCCSASWIIRVKNCGSYRVYYLKRTDLCPSAYCIEKSMYTTTSDTSSEESSSSSSQDITSSSTENTGSADNEDTTTTQETTTTDEISDHKSSGTTAGSLPTTPDQINTQTEVKSPAAGDDNTLTTPPPDYTQSQVLTEDSPDVLWYVGVAVVGILCLIIIASLFVIWRLRRDKKILKRKDSQDGSESRSESTNHYSDLPNPETIYYSINYDRETENNVENEKRASAQDRDMYLDAFHLPDPKTVEKISNVPEEDSNIKSMYLDMSSKPSDVYQDMDSGNRDMYVGAYRKWMQSPPVDETSQYNSPYECSSKDEESHDYTGLPKKESKMSEYSNDGYEPEENMKDTDIGVEKEKNRLSTLSYDDVTFDIK